MSVLRDWAREVFPPHVQEVYDDPFYMLDNVAGIRRGIEQMKAVAIELGLDFDQVVAELTTDFERRRVAHIIEHGEDMPL